MRRYKSSPRLKGWDYSSPGCYFVTFCTHGRKNLLGTIDGDQKAVHLSSIGKLCSDVAERIPERFPAYEIESHVVMPNHIHALIWIKPTDDSKVDLSRIIGAWKNEVSHKVHLNGRASRVWQTSFHDHIVRDEADHARLLEYIQNNPLRWALDCMYNEEQASFNHS